MKTKELKEIDKVSFKNVNGNLDGDYITLIGGVENKLYYAVERYSGKSNEKVPVTIIHFEEVLKKDEDEILNSKDSYIKQEKVTFLAGGDNFILYQEKGQKEANVRIDKEHGDYDTKKLNNKKPLTKDAQFITNDKFAVF